jgi:monoamine oxidase
VVLTLPFTVLRGVHLDASLRLSADKMRVIATLGYGTNAKTMIAFNERLWATRYGASGAAWSGRSHPTPSTPGKPTWRAPLGAACR